MKYSGMFDNLKSIRFEVELKRGYSLLFLFNHLPLLRGYTLDSEEELDLINKIQNGEVVKINSLTINGQIVNGLFYGKIMYAKISDTDNASGFYMNSGLVPLLSLSTFIVRTNIPLNFCRQFTSDDYITHREAGLIVKEWEMEHEHVNKIVLELFSTVERLAWSLIPF